MLRCSENRFALFQRAGSIASSSRVFPAKLGLLYRTNSVMMTVSTSDVLFWLFSYNNIAGERGTVWVGVGVPTPEIFEN